MVCRRRGLTWRLDLSEGIDLSIYLFGRFERPVQRLDLAQPAAHIGISVPEDAVRVERLDPFGIGLDGANIAQAQLGRELIAIASRLAEELVGVEEDDRR